MTNKTIIILCLITLFGTFLRIYKINSSPPSLYIDEADVGYQAYSLIKTGKDYFGNFIPFHIESFADNRTPLYIYLDTLFIYLFGLNTFAVRIPALISAIISIPLIYWLSLLVFEDLKIKDSNLAALLSSFILSVLPWHIQYSRMGFEVTLLLFLLILSLGFFLSWSKRKNFIFLVLSLVFFSLTPYVYSTAKLFIPILGIILFALFKNDLLKLPYKEKLISLSIILLIAAPQVIDLIKGTSTRRFAILSVFTDTNSQGPYQHLSWLASYSPKYLPFIFIHPATLTKIFLSFPSFLIYQIGQNYLSTFSPQFLIFQGDPNLRQNLPFSGEAGLVITLLFVIGIGFLISKWRNKISLLLIFLILLSPIPSAITKDGMFHATRLFILILPLVIVCGLGFNLILQTSQKTKYFYITIIALGLILSWEVFRDQFIRLAVYPNYSYLNWDYGWKKNVNLSYKLSPSYKALIVDSVDNTPIQTFYGFYHSIDPRIFQLKVNQPPITISGLNIKAHQFDDSNIYFSPFNINLIDQPLSYKFLVLVPAAQFKIQDHPNISIIKTISNPWGDPLYYFVTNKEVTQK